MQAQGHRPDVGVYNVVIEALSRSGVLLLQLKAAQLFQAAVRQGQLRRAPWPPTPHSLKCAAVPRNAQLFQAAVRQGQLRRAPLLTSPLPSFKCAAAPEMRSCSRRPCARASCGARPAPPLPAAPGAAAAAAAAAAGRPPLSALVRMRCSAACAEARAGACSAGPGCC